MGKVGLRSKSELVQYHAVRTHRQIAERQKLLGLVSSYEKLVPPGARTIPQQRAAFRMGSDQRVRALVSLAKRVATRVTSAKRISMMDTPAVPPVYAESEVAMTGAKPPPIAAEI
jgi:hypothetical protein